MSYRLKHWSDYKASPLIKAILDGNNELSRDLITQGADVNVRDREGRTALMCAAYKGNREIAQILIDSGADVNQRNKNFQHTALFYSIANNREEVARLLIEKGADVNVSDKDGRPLLLIAFENNNEEVARLLIEKGADVNVSGKDGRTPLLIAFENNNEEVARLLIENGADVNVSDKDGQTPLSMTARKNNEEFARLLIKKGADVNVSGKYGRTPLLIAFENNNEEVARLLIEKGADVNVSDKDGRTPLLNAARKNNKEFETPLFYASSPSVVRLLLDHGADVSLRNNQGESVLIHVIQNKDCYDIKSWFNLFSALVSCDGITARTRDIYGRTAMFYAVMKSNCVQEFKRIASILILKEAVLNDTDNNNVSVLSYFIERLCRDKFPLQDEICASETLTFFTQNAIKHSTIFHSTFNFLYAVLLKYLQNSNGVVNASGKKVFSNVLMVASKHGTDTEVECIENLKILLDKDEIQEALNVLMTFGVNPNSADSNGNTALHYATVLPFNGVSPEFVKNVLSTLVRHGVRINVKNQAIETPLHFCLSDRAWKLADKNDTWNGFAIVVEICEFLIEHDWVISERTRTGETVYHLIVKLFQKALYMSDKPEIREFICLHALDLLELFSRKTGGLPSILNKMNNKLNSPLHLWASLSLPSNENYVGHVFKGFSFQKLLHVILEHLLKPEMTTNPRNEEYQTPLHLCKTWTAVKLLIEAGANVHFLDREGRPPLLNAAKQQIFEDNPGHFFPDVEEDRKTFFETCLSLRLDIWSLDNKRQSIFTILVKSGVFELSDALIEVALELNPTILTHLLETICKDKSTYAYWKRFLITKILNSPNSPRNNDLNDALLQCCTNIKKLHDQGKTIPWDARSEPNEPPIEDHKSYQPNDSSLPKSNVKLTDVAASFHVDIANQLLLYGADHKICMDLYRDFPELRPFLTKKVDLDSASIVIPWTSYSKTHKDKLKRVSRKQELDTIGTFWFHKDPIGSGSFGHVFAGISEKDGREIAIKKIEKLRLVRPEDKREIQNLIALAECQQVVHYFFFDDSDKDFVYIILELMEGHLDDYFASSLFDVSRSELLCKDVLEGLAYLHQHSPVPILHRDLKPGNILYKLHPKLCLKIADFGLSSPLTIIGTTVLGTNVGTRCWVAPEVLSSATYQHSLQSDVFSCGLLLHYILSKQKHPFSPADCSKSREVLDVETQINMLRYKMEGWDDSISPEATHLIKSMLQKDVRQRPSAIDSLSHPFFWSNKKKMEFLSAVGNQYEFECPSTIKAACYHVTTGVEAHLENNFTKIVRYPKWDNPNYRHMAKVVAEMNKPIEKVNKKGATFFQNPRTYDTGSAVELVRFIRKAITHVSEASRPTDIRKLILEDLVFLKEFPHLLIEVYKAVTTHGWDTSREEIKYVLTIAGSDSREEIQGKLGVKEEQEEAVPGQSDLQKVQEEINKGQTYLKQGQEAMFHRQSGMQRGQKVAPKRRICIQQGHEVTQYQAGLQKKSKGISHQEIQQGQVDIQSLLQGNVEKTTRKDTMNDDAFTESERSAEQDLEDVQFKKLLKILSSNEEIREDVQTQFTEKGSSTNPVQKSTNKAEETIALKNIEEQNDEDTNIGSERSTEQHLEDFQRILKILSGHDDITDNDVDNCIRTVTNCSRGEVWARAFEGCCSTTGLDWKRTFVDAMRNIYQFLGPKLAQHKENNVMEQITDLTFLAHGEVRAPHVPCTLHHYNNFIESITTYVPWGCGLDASAAYGIATGAIHIDHVEYDGEVLPGRPNSWYSLPTGDNTHIPNVIFTQVAENGADPAYEELRAIHATFQRHARGCFIPFFPNDLHLEEIPLWYLCCVVGLIGREQNVTYRIHIASCLHPKDDTILTHSIDPTGLWPTVNSNPYCSVYISRFHLTTMKMRLDRLDIPDDIRNTFDVFNNYYSLVRRFPLPETQQDVIMHDAQPSTSN